MAVIRERKIFKPLLGGRTGLEGVSEAWYDAVSEAEVPDGPCKGIPESDYN
jgi:hypothetical protein